MKVHHSPMMSNCPEHWPVTPSDRCPLKYSQNTCDGTEHISGTPAADVLQPPPAMQNICRTDGFQSAPPGHWRERRGGHACQPAAAGLLAPLAAKRDAAPALPALKRAGARDRIQCCALWMRELCSDSLAASSGAARSRARTRVCMRARERTDLMLTIVVAHGSREETTAPLALPAPEPSLAHGRHKCARACAECRSATLTPFAHPLLTQRTSSRASRALPFGCASLWPGQTTGRAERSEPTPLTGVGNGGWGITWLRAALYRPQVRQSPRWQPWRCLGRTARAPVAIDAPAQAMRTAGQQRESTQRPPHCHAPWVARAHATPSSR